MRTIYRVANFFRRIYWFVFRPRTRGVKCVIENEGRWLMIRNSYGRGYWTFPGGRIGLRETPEHAARREAREEVGLDLGDLTFLGTYFSRRQYKRDTVYCFHASVPSSEHRIDGKEVSEAQWFPRGEIPKPIGQSVARVNRMLSSG